MCPGAAERRGAALAVVLVALIAIAGLTAGATIASRQAQRGLRGGLSLLRASAAADGAILLALKPWDRRRNQLAVGAADSSPTAAVAGASTVVRVLRLDADRFLIEAAARAPSAEAGAGHWAERSTSVVARLERPSPSVLGAVTTGGPLTLLDGASIDGRNTTPDGWTDCAPFAGADTVAIVAASVPGIQVARTAIVSGAVQPQALAADTGTYGRFGRDVWSTLRARADVSLDGLAGDRSPQPATDGALGCALGPDAWSDPRRDATGVSACATTYALTHARNGLTLHGPSRGQGLLLVDGDLTLDGNIEFAGVIVVRGVVHADRGALRLDGALLVAGGPGSTVLGAGTRVRFSRCAIARALDGVSPVSALRRRARAEVTR